MILRIWRRHGSTFRTGGLITGVIGILILPWKLIADPGGYIFTWLVGYSSLLGPVGGILIADYYFIRRQQLSLAGLYESDGAYAYTGGLNRRAVLQPVAWHPAECAGVSRHGGLMAPGRMPGWIVGMYDYAWFTGFLVAGGSYWLMMRAARLTYKEEVNYVPVD